MNELKAQSAVGSTRLVRLWIEDQHGGDLKAAVLQLGRLKLGIGWLIRYSGAEKPFACNRNVSWRYDRKVCLSALRLRIGLHIMPNDRAHLKSRAAGAQPATATAKLPVPHPEPEQ
jgi:hypothetical protein